MHRHRNVGQERFGPRRRDDHTRTAVFCTVAQVPERSAVRFVFHLGVRQCRAAFRIPVHEPRAAIDQPVVVEVDEDARDGGREFRIHREALALPIRAEAEAPELLVDPVTVLLAPLPSAREKCIASETVARESLFRQLAHQHGFRRDRGVVLARQPVGVVPAHPMVARQDVHRRVGRTVTEVRRAGDVRRRHRDDERRPRTVDFGMEGAGGEVARD
jgi:hypothetical protein